MVDMTKGVLRWVTGKTSPKYKPQMQVTLPVMAVGIRGTDFEAVVEPNGRGRVALYSGELEITEKKSEYTFILKAGQMVTFTPDGKVSRPKKIKGAKMVEDEEDD
jgi:ferric-dicitrate binding protein FerR (iron transport regulator)